MASSGREKIASGFTSKQKRSSTATESFSDPIDVGEREEARYKELEWGQKNDQAGKDLLE